MIITTKGKNALKLMIDLSLYQEERYVKLKEIADRQEISEKYLEHIVSILHKNGKVKSARGAKGGYRLVKQPSAYTVGEIIRSLQGSLAPTDCTNSINGICTKRNECFCYPLWEELDRVMNGVLEQTTLQDLINWKKIEHKNVK